MPCGCSTTPRWVTWSRSRVQVECSNQQRASVSGSMTMPAGWPGARSPESEGARCSGALGAQERSVPSELVQPVVIDAEVVRDLMHDRDGHLVQDLFAGRTHAKCWPPEDRDPVRQRTAGPAVISLGQGGAVIDTEQLRIARWWFVLNQEHHVVQEGEQLSRDVIECVPDGLVELLGGHLQHICQPVTVRGPVLNRDPRCDTMTRETMAR